MGIAHFAAGLVARPAARTVPLWVLLVAAELIDIIWAVSALVGLAIPDIDVGPWSHSLVMAVVWSLAALLLTALLYRSFWSGAVIGLIVFSHWVMDFISHPMNVGDPRLPVFLDGSVKVGLGLWSVIGIIPATFIEVTLVAIGIAIVVKTRKRTPLAASEG